MDIKAEEEKYADAQKRARESVIAALAPRAPDVYAIAVSGSGGPHIYTTEAYALGKAIADAGYDLLTGGLKGVMFDVTKGFLEANSGLKAIGIIPQGKQKKAAEVKDLLPPVLQVQTELPGKLPDGTGDHTGPSSRNRVLISVANKVILMPGGVGSAAEAELVGNYGKQVIAYDPAKVSGAGDRSESWRQTIRQLNIVAVQSLPEIVRWLGVPSDTTQTRKKTALP